jgi:cyclophilin family peptidyl-prolyl cis-trans isomerase
MSWRPQVTLTTNLGNMVVELDADSAPLTVNNFLQYVNDQFYDNTIIHRIVTSSIFVAQGGWLTPTPEVKAGLRAPIALEVGKGLSNVRGTIAMARTAALNSGHVAVLFEPVGQRGAGHRQWRLRCFWETGHWLATA